MTTSEYCNKFVSKNVILYHFYKKNVLKYQVHILVTVITRMNILTTVFIIFIIYFKCQIMSISMINENVRIRFFDQLKSLLKIYRKNESVKLN